MRHDAAKALREPGSHLRHGVCYLVGVQVRVYVLCLSTCGGSPCSFMCVGGEGGFSPPLPISAVVRILAPGCFVRVRAGGMTGHLCKYRIIYVYMFLDSRRVIWEVGGADARGVWPTSLLGCGCVCCWACDGAGGFCV